jgi:hypothetical protein
MSDDYGTLHRGVQTYGYKVIKPASLGELTLPDGRVLVGDYGEMQALAERLCAAKTEEEAAAILAEAIKDAETFQQGERGSGVAHNHALAGSTPAPATNQEGVR